MPAKSLSDKLDDLKGVLSEASDKCYGASLFFAGERTPEAVAEKAEKLANMAADVTAALLVVLTDKLLELHKIVIEAKIETRLQALELELEKDNE